MKLLSTAIFLPLWVSRSGSAYYSRLFWWTDRPLGFPLGWWLVWHSAVAKLILHDVLGIKVEWCHRGWAILSISICVNRSARVIRISVRVIFPVAIDGYRQIGRPCLRIEVSPSVAINLPTNRHSGTTKGSVHQITQTHLLLGIKVVSIPLGSSARHLGIHTWPSPWQLVVRWFWREIPVTNIYRCCTSQGWQVSLLCDCNWYS